MRWSWESSFILVAVLAIVAGCWLALAPTSIKADELKEVPGLGKAVAPEEGPTDLTGVYLFQGKEADIVYHGIATVWKVQDVYLVHYSSTCETKKGPTFFHYKGQGLMQKGVFAVSWAQGEILGVTAYALHGRPGSTGFVMHGRWVANVGGANAKSETLTFLSKIKGAE